MLKQKHAASGIVCIETLESRRLLSASVMSHAMPAVVETPAVKAKKTVPAIAGNIYVATIKEPSITVSVDFVFSTESAKGALSGYVSESFVGESATFPSTGTVTLGRAVTFHTAPKAPPLHLTAKLSADLSKLTGRVFLHGPHAAATPFTATLYTPPS